MTTRRFPTPVRRRSAYSNTDTTFDTVLQQFRDSDWKGRDLSALEGAPPTAREWFGTNTRVVLMTADPLTDPIYRIGFIELQPGQHPYLYLLLKKGDPPSQDPLDDRSTVIAYQPRGDSTPFYNLETGRPFSTSKLRREEKAKWDEWAKRNPETPPAPAD